MRLHFGKTEQPRSGARRDLRQERFTAYFPRLFAYACAATGNDEAARDVAVAAFTSTFSMPDMREVEFEVALFKAARELCNNGEYRVRRHNDGLSPRERDVISLVLDGQLDQTKIAELLGVRADTVSMTLARGLRKLRTRLAPELDTGAALPSFS
ncbi:MAG: sigma factor-like helix-turn-helix DNA-binding protein [Chloroflexota bacterium]